MTSGDRILAVAESVMPTCLIEGVERISDLFEQHGTYLVRAY
jgi:hypothetical protein